MTQVCLRPWGVRSSKVNYTNLAMPAPSSTPDTPPPHVVPALVSFAVCAENTGDALLHSLRKLSTPSKTDVFLLKEKPDSKAALIESGHITRDGGGKLRQSVSGKHLSGFELSKSYEHLGQPQVGKAGLLLHLHLFEEVSAAIKTHRLPFAMRTRLNDFVNQIDTAINEGKCPLGFTTDTGKSSLENAALLYAWRHVHAAGVLLLATPTFEEFPSDLFESRRLSDDLERTRQLARSRLKSVPSGGNKAPPPKPAPRNQPPKGKKKAQAPHKQGQHTQGPKGQKNGKDGEASKPAAEK